MKKSKFKLTHANFTTGNAGLLIPFLVLPTLPNDTFRISLTSFIRAQPMLAPLMHHVKIVTQYWYVPYRLIWDNWTEFITGGEQLEYIPAVPVLPPNSTFEAGSLGDYMGYPINVDCAGISVLPFRAYNLIWNEWYRVENLQDPLIISFDDGVDTSTNTQKVLSPSWRRDYFTTSEVFTQRGSSVSVPVYEYAGEGSTIITCRPVLRFVSALLRNEKYFITRTQVSNANHQAIIAALSTLQYEDFKSVVAPGKVFWINVNGTDVLFETITSNNGTAGFSNTLVADDSHAQYTDYINAAVTYQGYSGYQMGHWSHDGKVDNLVQLDGYVRYAIGQEGATLGSVNIRDLRAASALQRYAERSLIWGNRYEEFIMREFGMKPRDSRVQRPEYLGGGSGSLQVSEVLQTAEGQDTGVGTMRGHGISSIGQRPIKFRSPEHGIILGLISVRPQPIYTQGVHREWLKKSRIDFYTPELASIGMQEVLQRELYVSADNQDALFGYSDRYQEYRYEKPKLTGEFRTTLDFWTMAREFEQAPQLNNSFVDMSSSADAFARPFATGTTAHQYLMMLRNNVQAYRVVPKRAKNILK